MLTRDFLREVIRNLELSFLSQMGIEDVRNLAQWKFLDGIFVVVLEVHCHLILKCAWLVFVFRSYTFVFCLVRYRLSVKGADSSIIWHVFGKIAEANEQEIFSLTFKKNSLLVWSFRVVWAVLGAGVKHIGIDRYFRGVGLISRVCAALSLWSGVEILFILVNARTRSKYVNWRNLWVFRDFALGKKCDHLGRLLVIRFDIWWPSKTNFHNFFLVTKESFRHLEN